MITPGSGSTSYNIASMCVSIKWATQVQFTFIDMHGQEITTLMVRIFRQTEGESNKDTICIAFPEFAQIKELYM